MFESYAHSILQSLLGGYVKNVDVDALKISVWNGDIHIKNLEVKEEAINQICRQNNLPLKCSNGSIGSFTLKLSWSNLSDKPIQIEIDDLYLAVQVVDVFKEEDAEEVLKKSRSFQERLKSKRQTIEAYEKAEALESEAKPKESSTFASRLLTKLLDNLQIQVNRVHIRIKDSTSDPKLPLTFGVILHQLIVQSADRRWNYTLSVRGAASTAMTGCLRKRVELKKLGVYWNLSSSNEAIKAVQTDSVFHYEMSDVFFNSDKAATLNYMIEPMSYSMRMLVNDRAESLSISHQQFSQRVVSRLGTSWLVDTIEAIGDEAWASFVSRMPELAAGKLYTISFVFSEAWSVANDMCEEEDEIPTLKQFESAIRSCFQWSPAETNRISESINAFRKAAVFVMQEKTTFIDIEAKIDNIGITVKQNQYHSLLSVLSFFSLHKRRMEFIRFRPTNSSIMKDPAAWWRYAINAVLVSVREQLSRVDWDHVTQKKKQRDRYISLFQLMNEGTAEAPAKEFRYEFDLLEEMLDIEDLLLFRKIARKKMKKKIALLNSNNHPAESKSTSYFSYGYWFGGTKEINSSDNFTDKDRNQLYEAIDYHPKDDESDLANKEQTSSQIVRFRAGAKIGRTSWKLLIGYRQKDCELFEKLRPLISAQIDETEIKFVKRSNSVEFGLIIRDLSVLDNYSVNSHYRCIVDRINLEDVIKFHPDTAGEMSGVRLLKCEAPLPLVNVTLEIPPADASADLGLSIVSQPLNIVFHLPFMLEVGSFFSRPVDVDLSDLDNVAWENASALTKYSAAQLREAVSQRTKLKLQMDITSPNIRIVELINPKGEDLRNPLTDWQNGVILTLYLGHVRAQSDLQPIDKKDYEDSVTSFTSNLPDEQLHDTIEFHIRGVEALISTFHMDKEQNTERFNISKQNNQFNSNIVQKTNMMLVLRTSVAPEDPTIPLVKIDGELQSIHVIVSSLNYSLLLQLLASISYAFSIRESTQSNQGLGDLHSKKPLSSISSNKHIGASHIIAEDDVELDDQLNKVIDNSSSSNILSDDEIVKLWNRQTVVACFMIRKFIVSIQDTDESVDTLDRATIISTNEIPILQSEVNDIQAKVLLRTFDRTFNFTLGSFFVRDMLRERKLSHESLNDEVFLVSSGIDQNRIKAMDNFESQDHTSTPSKQLFQISLTMITDKAQMLHDSSLWVKVFQNLDTNELWCSLYNVPISIDVCFDSLTINFHRDTLSSVVSFFKIQRENRYIKLMSKQKREGQERRINFPSPPPPPSVGGIRQRFSSFGSDNILFSSGAGAGAGGMAEWASSFVEQDSECHNEKCVEKEVLIQIRCGVKYLALLLVDEDNSPLALFAAEGFSAGLQRSNRSVNVVSSLSCVTVEDLTSLGQTQRQIISSAAVNKQLDYSSNNLNKPPMLVSDNNYMLKFAFEAFSEEDSGEKWHPGYNKKVLLRLNSPRIRFIYRFVEDIRIFLLYGPLMESLQVSPEVVQTSNSEPQIHDKEPLCDESRQLAQKKANSLPLLDICLFDSIIDMPRNSLSKDSIFLRFGLLHITNTHHFIHEESLQEEKETEVNLETTDILVTSVELLSSLRVSLSSLRIVTSVHKNRTVAKETCELKLHSLLGATDFVISASLASNIDVSIESTPIRFVCSQHQYSLLLSLPLSNLSEPPLLSYQLVQAMNEEIDKRNEHPMSVHFESPTSSSHLPDIAKNAAQEKLSTSTLIESTLSISIELPNISIGLLKGWTGFQPTENGDLAIATLLDDHPVDLIAMLDIVTLRFKLEYILSEGYSFEKEYIETKHFRSKGDLKATLDLISVGINDARPQQTIVPAYRSFFLLKSAVEEYEPFRLHFERFAKKHFERENALSTAYHSSDVGSGSLMTGHLQKSMSESCYQPDSQMKSPGSFIVPSTSTVQNIEQQGECGNHSDIRLHIAGLKLIPSSIIFVLLNFFTQLIDTEDHMESMEQTEYKSHEEVEGEDKAQREMKESSTLSDKRSETQELNMNSISVNVTLDDSNILLVENQDKINSRALMLNWHASVEYVADITGQRLVVDLDDIHATSRLKKMFEVCEDVITADDCLEPFKLSINLAKVDDSVHFRMVIDRIVKIRLGYLDCITITSALSAVLNEETEADSAASELLESNVDEGNSLSPLSPTISGSEKSNQMQKCLFYGSSLIQFYYGSVDKKLNPDHAALGYFNCNWGRGLKRKYLVISPMKKAYKSRFQQTHFRILPGAGSLKKVNDPVCFGDSVVLMDEEDKVISKYDHLGASGYLGPDGNLGEFSCTLWRNNTTSINAEKNRIRSGDQVVFEGITAYRHPSHPSFGGYLMFNGFGDAPVVFVVDEVENLQCTANPNCQKSSNKENLKHKVESFSPSNVQSLRLTIPGVYLTIVDDSNKMLLPLFHVQTNRVRCRARCINRMSQGSFFIHFGLEISYYNYQLAVWEPVLEPYDLQLAYHLKGGVLCDNCMYQLDNSTLKECTKRPKCPIRPALSSKFTQIACRAWESKRNINRTLIKATDDENLNDTNTLLVQASSILNLNISQEMMNVLLQFVAVFTQQALDKSQYLGSNIYIDNQSGIPFYYCIASNNSDGGISMKNPPVYNHSELPDDVDDKRNKIKERTWEYLANGTCIATNIIAHEAPAGRIQGPLRRLLWLQPGDDSLKSIKPIVTSVGYANQSFFKLHTGDSAITIICETRAEKGTLVVRIRSTLQIVNRLGISVEVTYPNNLNAEKEVILLEANQVHFVPIQHISHGSIQFRPMPEIGGRLALCSALSLIDILKPKIQNSASSSSICGNIMHNKSSTIVEATSRLLFYWTHYPPNANIDESDSTSLSPFQAIIVHSRNQQYPDISLKLHPPIIVENLLPHPLQYRVFSIPFGDKIPAGEPTFDLPYTKHSGEVMPGQVDPVCLVDLVTNTGTSSIVLSVAIPTVGFHFSHLSAQSIIYGHNQNCSTLRLVNGEGTPLNLNVEIEMNDKCLADYGTDFFATNDFTPAVCRIYAEYWVIDRTGFDLMYSQLSSAKSNDYRQIINAQSVKDPNYLACFPMEIKALLEDNSVSLTMIGYSNSPNQCKMAIQVQTLDPSPRSTQLWSDYFDISVSGLRGQLCVPPADTNKKLTRKVTKQLSTQFNRMTSIASMGLIPEAKDDNISCCNVHQYEFGVMIDCAPEKFSRTRIISFTSRYQFINYAVPYQIQIRQVGAPDSVFHCVLPNEKENSFSWFHQDLTKRVQIRVVTEEKNKGTVTSNWSGAFDIASVGDFSLKMKICTHEALKQFHGYRRVTDSDVWQAQQDEVILHIAIELHDPSFIIVFRNREESRVVVPYLIRNDCTLHDLVVWQRHPEQIDTTMKDKPYNLQFISSLSSHEFIPDEPSGNPTLCIQARSIALLHACYLKQQKGNARKAGNIHAETNFEVTLDKPHRLTGIVCQDLHSDDKKQLWIEVSVEGATKIVTVTDIITGSTEEHERRKRSMMLRSWKMLNRCIEKSYKSCYRTKKEVEIVPGLSSCKKSGQKDFVVVLITIVEARFIDLVVDFNDLSSFKPFLQMYVEGPDKRKIEQLRIEAQGLATYPFWLPVEENTLTIAIERNQENLNNSINLEFRLHDLVYGSSVIGTGEVKLDDFLKELQNEELEDIELWCPIRPISCVGKSDIVFSATNEIFPAVRIQISALADKTASKDDTLVLSNYLLQVQYLKWLQNELCNACKLRQRFQIVMEHNSLDVGNVKHEQMIGEDVDNESDERSSITSFSNETSRTSLATSIDEEQDQTLVAVVMNLTGLKLPSVLFEQDLIDASPKLYCTIEFDKRTRGTDAAISFKQNNKESENTTSKNEEKQGVAPTRAKSSLFLSSFIFTKGLPLGLDLVYVNGKLVIQSIHLDGQCGQLLAEGKIKVGDVVVAINTRSLLNLSKESAFQLIQNESRVCTLDSQSRLDDEEEKSPDPSQKPLVFKYRISFRQAEFWSRGLIKNDEIRFFVEWNRRIDFEANHNSCQGSGEKRVKIRVYARNKHSERGLSTDQERRVMPFLYFFGEDHTMDELDHSRPNRNFDILVGESWIVLPQQEAEKRELENSTHFYTSSTLQQQVCAVYPPVKHQQASNVNEMKEMEIIGMLQLALKWQVDDHAGRKKSENLCTYFHLELPGIGVSFVDQAIGSTQEILYGSISGFQDIPGIQLNYAILTGAKRLLNFRVDQLQIDNQLMDTNYPVMVCPVRSNYEITSTESEKELTVPTLHIMAILNQLPAVVYFEYIFAQLLELEIKLEDFTLVAIVKLFSGVNWKLLHPERHEEMAKTKDKKGQPYENLAIELMYQNNFLQDIQIPQLDAEFDKKIVVHWLLLRPISVNVTFSSTTDKPLTNTILSENMSTFLRTIISAATTLVSNLDRAPIEIPEFYIENVFETKHALLFYILKHYITHGMRSWYKIVGSVDFLGNPVGLVSTLGTGVKDFFYTPAQMLLENEDGLRIENLRTGMTKGSKSLLKNTAVGIFHTTGKITETLGKGIAMLAMDENYNAERQQRAIKQSANIHHVGDGIMEGGKGLVGGVWEGVKGVVADPVRGGAEDGAGGFVLGLGKGFAGLIVKPTAGVLDLLTSVSQGVKNTAAAIDGSKDMSRGKTRIRLPRRFFADGVMVPFSQVLHFLEYYTVLAYFCQREAEGSAILVLKGLNRNENYIYHCYYGDDKHRGLVVLSDKRILCMSSKGHKVWEIALDSTVSVAADSKVLCISRQSANSSNDVTKKDLKIQCDSSSIASLFKIAVESVRADVSETRYIILNMENNYKKQKERQIVAAVEGADLNHLNEEEGFTDDELMMEKRTDGPITDLAEEDLQSQPLRSVRVEVSHALNKDSHSKVPIRALDSCFSFTVFEVSVFGGPYEWTVYRRFSDFQKLHEDLSARGFNMSSLPTFPSRAFFLSTRESVVKYRQELLGLYLQAICMNNHLCQSKEALEFLTSGASNVKIGIAKRSSFG